MTKIKMKTGVDVYTELSVAEVRQYLSTGTKTGCFLGYTDVSKTTPIYIAVNGIEWIYLQ